MESKNKVKQEKNPLSHFTLLVATHVRAHADTWTKNKLHYDNNCNHTIAIKKNPSSLACFLHLDSFTFTVTVDTVSCMFHMLLVRHHTWFQWAAPYQQLSEPWYRRQVRSREASQTRWAGPLQLVFLTGDKMAKLTTPNATWTALLSGTFSNQPASCLFPCRTLAKPSSSSLLSQPAVGIKHFKF